MLEGAVGAEIQDNEFSALGAEAFLPKVNNQTYSMFAYEEIKLNPITFQFGARYDHQSNDSELVTRNFDALSTSAAIVYNPAADYAVSLGLGYSQRPPTYVELLADGLHIATGTFELGDPNLSKEDSISLDLSIKKQSGCVTGGVSAFYYRFNDFTSLQPTGSDFTEDGEDFPIFAYQASGADFYGAELEATFHVLETVSTKQGDPRLDLTFRADFVNARDRDTGEALPRVPPFRSSLLLDYQIENFGARLEGQWATHQDRTAEYELPTDGYFLLNAGLSYDLKIAEVTTTFYVKGVNLLDQEARQSTSFLKDIAPLSGRGVVIGLRTVF